MKITKCPLCDGLINETDNIIYRSVVCGHLYCANCVVSAYPFISQQNEDKITKNNTTVKCLVCSETFSADNFVTWSSEINVYNRALGIRKKVMNVLNFDRACFDDSPSYNDFIESREEYIDLLINKQNSEEAAKIDELLHNLSITYQSKILETEERAKKKHFESIKKIFDEEGNFYELVKLSYGPGFHLNMKNVQHPFYFQYSDLFKEKSIQDNLLNASNSYDNLEAYGKEKLEQLFQNLPNIIKFDKKPSNTWQRSMASGHNPENAKLKAAQETYAYFIIK